MAKCSELFEIWSTQKVPLLIVLGYRHLWNEEKELVWSHLQVESFQFGSDCCPRLCLVIRQPWKQPLRSYANRRCQKKNGFNVALKLCIIACSFNELLSQFLGKLIRSPGSPRKRKGSEALEEEIWVWNSQGGGKDKRLCFFFSSAFLSLKELSPELMITQQTTRFKLCTKDYITTMYPAWGQFLIPENLLTNPDILECILWEWVW